MISHLLTLRLSSQNSGGKGGCLDYMAGSRRLDQGIPAGSPIVRPNWEVCDSSLSCTKLLCQLGDFSTPKPEQLNKLVSVWTAQWKYLFGCGLKCKLNAFGIHTEWTRKWPCVARTRTKPGAWKQSLPQPGRLTVRGSRFQSWLCQRFSGCSF